MYCTSCNRFLGDKVKVCDYCGAKQKRRPAATPPQAPPVKNARLAVSIICLLLVMTVLPLLIILLGERADERQQFTLPHTQEPTTWNSGAFEWNWEGWGDTLELITSSRQLTDNPNDYYFRRVSVLVTVDSYTRHEAGMLVYGTRYPHAVYILYAEDETGPLLLVIGRNHDWQSGTLRFNGRFLGLRSVEGELTPLLEVADWERY